MTTRHKNERDEHERPKPKNQGPSEEWIATKCPEELDGEIKVQSTIVYLQRGAQQMSDADWKRQTARRIHALKVLAR